MGRCCFSVLVQELLKRSRLSRVHTVLYTSLNQCHPQTTVRTVICYCFKIQMAPFNIPVPSISWCLLFLVSGHPTAAHSH